MVPHSVPFVRRTSRSIAVPLGAPLAIAAQGLSGTQRRPLCLESYSTDINRYRFSLRLTLDELLHRAQQPFGLSPFWRAYDIPAGDLYPNRWQVLLSDLPDAFAMAFLMTGMISACLHRWFGSVGRCAADGRQARIMRTGRNAPRYAHAEKSTPPAPAPTPPRSPPP